MIGEGGDIPYQASRVISHLDKLKEKDCKKFTIKKELEKSKGNLRIWRKSIPSLKKIF